MARQSSRLALFFSLPFLSIISLATCSLFGPSVPSELVGKWFWHVSSSTAEAFTFTEHSVMWQWFDYDNSSNDASRTDQVTNVDLSTNQLLAGTEWYAWHVLNSTTAVIIWHDGIQEPSYPADWWTNSANVYTKQ